MDLGLGTVLEVSDIVRRLVEMYQRVEGVPAQVAKLGHRLEALALLLDRLEAHMRRAQRNAMVNLREKQRDNLVSVIEETRATCEQIGDIFDKLERQVGPKGLTLRYKWVANFWYAFGPSSDAVSELVLEIEQHKADIDIYLGLMGVEGQDHSLRVIQNVQKQSLQMQRDVANIKFLLEQKAAEAAKDNLNKTAQLHELGQKLAEAQLQVEAKERRLREETAKLEAREKELAEIEARRRQREKEREAKRGPEEGEIPGPQSSPAIQEPTSTSLPKTPRPRPDPSPSPRSDYNVLFVDPRNGGRSALSAAFLNLLYEEAKAVGAPGWRISRVDSAGFFIRNGSDCLDEIESIRFSHASYRLPLHEGGEPLSPVPCDALFDNTAYTALGAVGRTAAELRRARVSAVQRRGAAEKALRTRLSVGMTRDAFKTYDFVLCFTRREHNNLLKLRDALIAKDGRGARAKGKGSIVHLGRYLSSDGIPREIVEIMPMQDKAAERAKWNGKVAQLKTAIKGFLRQEMGWDPIDSPLPLQFGGDSALGVK